MDKQSEYLKYCSNLDDDEYNMLWENYEVRNTWIDKISEFVFNICMKLRKNKKN